MTALFPPMRCLCFVLLAVLAQGAEPVHANTTLTLKNGKVFKNVKITSETDDAVYVRYNAGMVKIFKSELSPEMQKDYPTAQQRQTAELLHRESEAARIRAKKEAEAADNLARIKSEHSSLIARVIKSAPAEREIRADRFGQPVLWSLRFDEPAQNLLFVSMKTPVGGAPEERFVFEIPLEEFQNLVSLFRKFESWSSICSKESPKPTVEKSIGTFATIECTFRYHRNAGGTLWIGPDVIQEDDARHFLALSTFRQELADEHSEIQQKNQSVADRLK
jgi:hypothetical protein